MLLEYKHLLQNFITVNTNILQDAVILQLLENMYQIQVGIFPFKVESSIFFINCTDKTLPEDLFGYWILNDDLLFLGSYRNFTAIGNKGKERL